jgi:hypothetical protein
LNSDVRQLHTDLYDLTDDEIIDSYFDFIKSSLNDIVHTHIEISEFTSLLSDILGYEISDILGYEISDTNISSFNSDLDGLVCDYQFLFGIFNDFGYLNIYYLVPPLTSSIFVTELSVSFE